uniref:Uncharacterized protein n=1 Tax=Wuchereria bancrofti TaxID=6293 RepID=A0A1I8E8S2_WUCBA
MPLFLEEKSQIIVGMVPVIKKVHPSQHLVSPSRHFSKSSNRFDKSLFWHPFISFIPYQVHMKQSFHRATSRMHFTHYGTCKVLKCKELKLFPCVPMYSEVWINNKDCRLINEWVDEDKMKDAGELIVSNDSSANFSYDYYEVSTFFNLTNHNC